MGTRRPRTYTVRYERDETGWWVASIKEVRGCHTQARSIAQARQRIREALGLFVASPEKVSLVDQVQLPKELRGAIRRLVSAKKRAEVAQELAARAAREAARELTRLLTVRDAGELLGISHQRVQQLLSKEAAQAMAQRSGRG
jgi:predicted RNase H-like HicB family nuclease